MCANFFRGTQLSQDVKFKDKDKQLIKERAWPKAFDAKVDLKKINLEPINDWIEERITEILGDDDDIVINFAKSHLELTEQQKTLCPKSIQISLTGFLTKDAGPFMEQLWDLLLQAQETPDGIAPQLRNQTTDQDKKKSSLSAEAQNKLQQIKENIAKQKREMEKKVGGGSGRQRKSNSFNDGGRDRENAHVRDIPGDERQRKKDKSRERSFSFSSSSSDNRSRASNEIKRRRNKDKERSGHTEGRHGGYRSERDTKDRRKLNGRRRSRSRSRSRSRERRRIDHRDHRNRSRDRDSGRDPKYSGYHTERPKSKDRHAPYRSSKFESKRR